MKKALTIGLSILAVIGFSSAQSSSNEGVGDSDCSMQISEIQALTKEVKRLKFEKQELELELVPARIAKNGFQLQTLLEVIAIQNSGYYITSLPELYKEGVDFDFFKTFTNPINHKKWGMNEGQSNGVIFMSPIPKQCVPGAIYFVVSSSRDSYVINACGQDGQIFHDGKGVFTLKSV